MLRLEARFWFLFAGGDEESAAQLRALCSPTPQPDEERIVCYLENGFAISGFGHTGHDRITDTMIHAGVDTRSDGTWIWLNLLTYYVKVHHFCVPTEFVEHMRSRGWEPPSEDEIDIDKVLDEYTRSFGD